MVNSAFYLAGIFVVALVAGGCRPPTKAEVIGTYTYSNNAAVDKIILNPDGTFQERLSYADGQTWSITNSWTLIGQNIQLDTCYQFFDDDKMTAKLEPFVLKQPQLVWMCNFSWEGNGMARYDWHFMWLKAEGP